MNLDSMSHSGILISHLLTRWNYTDCFDDANFEVGTKRVKTKGTVVKEIFDRNILVFST